MRADPEHIAVKELLRQLDRRCRAFHREFDRCHDEFTSRSVHELRVQSRRLLAWLMMVEALVPDSPVERVRRAARASLKGLARLRDAQVEFELAQAWRHRLRGVGPLLQELRRRESKLKQRARRRFRGARRGELRRAITALREGVAAAGAGKAAVRINPRLLSAAIDRSFAPVLRLLARAGDGGPEAIHRLRVAFKKFRYLSEGAAGLLGNIDGARLQTMRRFQRLLGRIQDLEVLRHRIDRFTKRHRKHDKVMSALRAAVVHRQSRLIGRFHAAAPGIPGLWPPQPQTRSSKPK